MATDYTRSVDAAFASLAGKADCAVHVRVKVDDQAGSTWELNYLEGEDWLQSVSWTEQLDTPTATATIVVFREIASMSLAPSKSANKPNSDGVVLQEQRKVTIYTQLRPVGFGPQDSSGTWDEVFVGRITTIDWGGEDNAIKLSCRDLSCDEADYYIEGDSDGAEEVYGSSGGTAVQTVMQNIINAEMPSSGKFARKTLFTPDSPGWNVIEFRQKRELLLGALRVLADMIGWFVHYRWDDSVGSTFKLTLWDANRNNVTAADVVFGADLYRVRSLRRSVEHVRNEVDITYSSAAGSRSTDNSEDSASVTAYGRRYAAISEASTSGIDSSSEASALGDTILNDLKEPDLEATVELLAYYPYVLLGAIVRLDGTTRWWDDDSTRGWTVVGLSHSVKPGEAASTSLSLVERELGGSSGEGSTARNGGRWVGAQGREERPGQAPSQSRIKAPGSRTTRVWHKGSSAQTISPSTWTTVQFDDTSEDRSGTSDFDTTTNYDFTAPADGFYSFAARVEIDSRDSAGDANVKLALYDGTERVVIGPDHPSAGAGTPNTVATLTFPLHYMESGDTVEVQIWHDESDTEDLAGGALVTFLVVTNMRTFP